jgi:hypothetical protein
MSFSPRLLAIGVILFSIQSTAFAQASAPTVPAKVESRRSVVDTHVYAARFENTSQTTLSLKIVMVRANGSGRKTFHLTIEAGKIKEIGALQGWKVFPGDTATISCDGYSPLTTQVK